MRRLLIAGAICLGGVVGVAAGLLSLDAQTWIVGPRHASSRYSDVGGGIRALLEGSYAVGVGTLLGARLVWLCFGAARRAARTRVGPGSRVAKLDLALLGMVFVWLYLIYASW
jgi:hypothetical protein